MEKLTLQPTLNLPRTEIYFGLDHLVETCHAISKQGVILVDEKIHQIHGATLQKKLGYELISIRGEKTRDAKEALEDELFKRKLGKGSLMVAVGGGTTTDLIGFVASTYMRGAPLISIPTTLLGMVDAAIGGKTGIDTPFGKNLIGAFYLPKAIFIEPKFLETLPEIELQNGLSEILKYGLIYERSIWEKCANWKEELPFLIRRSIECKLDIVSQDFEEKGGLRRILNFGHTVGHALELLSHYHMAHGEAIALGCMAESYLSYRLGYLSLNSLEKILAVYYQLGYLFKPLEAKAFLQAVSMDKKAKEGAVRFVLINQIGSCVPFEGQYCTSITPKELEHLIEWINDSALKRALK